MNAAKSRMVWVLLAASLPADAHRLDEYLQATRLSLDTDRVGLEIDLTPGVAVASQVLGWIDTDRNGAISKAEGDRYAQQMLSSVVLSVDGRQAPVQLLEAVYPDPSDMKLGLGTIRLRTSAGFPGAGVGHHQIAFSNTHRREVSVYLINALVPSNPRIEIGGQRRDIAQHTLILDYTVAADPTSFRAVSMLAGLALAGRLFLRRRGRASPAVSMPPKQ